MAGTSAEFDSFFNGIERLDGGDAALQRFREAHPGMHIQRMAIPMNANGENLAWRRLAEGQDQDNQALLMDSHPRRGMIEYLVATPPGQNVIPLVNPTGNHRDFTIDPNIPAQPSDAAADQSGTQPADPQAESSPAAASATDTETVTGDADDMAMIDRRQAELRESVEADRPWPPETPPESVGTQDHGAFDILRNPDAHIGPMSFDGTGAGAGPADAASEPDAAGGSLPVPSEGEANAVGDFTYNPASLGVLHAQGSFNPATASFKLDLPTDSPGEVVPPEGRALDLGSQTNAALTDFLSHNGESHRLIAGGRNPPMEIYLDQDHGNALTIRPLNSGLQPSGAAGVLPAGRSNFETFSNTQIANHYASPTPSLSAGPPQPRGRASIRGGQRQGSYRDTMPSRVPEHLAPSPSAAGRTPTQADLNNAGTQGNLGHMLEERRRYYQGHSPGA